MCTRHTFTFILGEPSDSSARPLRHAHAPHSTGPPEHPKALTAAEIAASEESLANGGGFLKKSNVLNVPLRIGVSSQEFRAAFNDHVLPHMRDYKPQLVFISAGFDGHRDDPYGQWIGSGIAEVDYKTVTAEIRAAARECGAPVISVLEGGYNLTALKKNIKAHCAALIGDDIDETAPPAQAQSQTPPPQQQEAHDPKAKA